MSRTGEKVLGIIAIILNVISIIFLFFIALMGSAISNPSVYEEFETEIYSDPTITEGLTEEDTQFLIESVVDSFTFAAGVSWVFIVITIISIVLSIIAIVQVNNKPKNAGIMFIIASVLSALLSPQGILLLIAGIMSLVRKPKDSFLEKTL